MKNFLIYLAVLLLCVGGCSNEDVPKKDFNIVLITIDTLRADHLSCYGYERETSPNIDKVAEKGILFKNVIAPSSWTAPSMVSLFTSTYPINHGVIHGLAFRKKREKRKQYSQAVFSDELATLPEILKKQGYTTFGVSSNHNLTPRFGFARSFDYFKYRGYHLGSATAKYINELVYLWEDKIKKTGKYFLWIHYMDPHHPYNARSPWIEQYTSQSLTPKLNLLSKSASELNNLIPTFKENPQELANLLALYDSEINYVDSYVGDLIKRLELDKNTLLIITSDHGEQFLEHGKIGHPFNLHSEVLNVPLIVKLPDVSEMVTIENQVSLLDIMPTISHILDTEPPEQTCGKSFLEDKESLTWLKTILFRKRGARYNFAELDAGIILKTITTPEWKYIYNYKNQTQQLYNVISDPNELNNLADKKALQSDQLKKQLLNWVSTSKTYPIKSQSFELSQKEKEKLEAMGYLQTQEETSLKKSHRQLIAESGKKIEEAAEKSSQRTRIVESEIATIELVDKSDNSIGINLISNIPVQGVQFTIEGVKVNEVRTISRASGLVASFNKESGIIILMASSGKNIAPGKGLIAEITCDKVGSVNLSAIKIMK
jgi:arylsulfatase A-like enzyme